MTGLTRTETDSTGDPRPQVVGGDLHGRVMAPPRDPSWGRREASSKGHQDRLTETAVVFVVTVADGVAEVVATAQGSILWLWIRQRLMRALRRWP